ncbi:MAG: hypothetical protein F4103_12355 [Boseongicola sp. SB0673_bin_14]|nr:hypothetical protein [Boseongicola sp. SB0673_bin_14]
MPGLSVHGRDAPRRQEAGGASVNRLDHGRVGIGLSRGTRGLERLFAKLSGRLAAPAWAGGERIVAAALDRRDEGVSGIHMHEDMLPGPNPLALDGARLPGLTLGRRMTGLAGAMAAEQGGGS